MECPKITCRSARGSLRWNSAHATSASCTIVCSEGVIGVLRPQPRYSTASTEARGAQRLDLAHIGHRVRKVPCRYSTVGALRSAFGSHHISMRRRSSGRFTDRPAAMGRAIPGGPNLQKKLSRRRCAVR
jgi:hypothetical protein